MDKMTYTNEYGEEIPMEVPTHEAREPRRPRVNPWAGGIDTLVANVDKGLYNPISTGIKQLNNILDGGFINQQLIGISGKPGEGKSAATQWLSESLLLNEGMSVVYMCLEMSTPQLQARSISRLMYDRKDLPNLSHLEILRGKRGWREGAELYNRMYGDKIAYIGLDRLKEATIDNFVKVYKEFAEYNLSMGRKPPAFVVDYLQLLRVGNLSETEGLVVIMPKLKSLAMDYNTIGFVIIANNRESNKENQPTMASGRGSSSIEFGLDLMLAVSKEKASNGIAKVTITPTKGRWTGDEGVLTLDFRGKYMHFTVNDKDLYGEPLPTREAKAVNDIANQPDRRGEVENIPLNI